MYNSSPIAVTFPDAMRDSHVTFTVTPKDSAMIQLSHLAGDDDEQVYTVNVNDTIILHGQRIIIAPTKYYGAQWYDKDIEIEKLPLEWVADRYRSAVGIRQEEDEASILKLALKDNNALRAQNILNTMVIVYNDITVDDKNLMVQNTTNFINGRLAVIEKELGGVEDEIVSFKRENQIIDLGSAAVETELEGGTLVTRKYIEAIKQIIADNAIEYGEIDKLAEFLDLLKEQCDKADKITPDTEGDLE